MPEKHQADRSAVAGRLRMAREQAGLSQAQAAQVLGLHRPTVSEIEAGRRRVSVDELVQFASAYRVSLNWLAEGSSEIVGEDADRISLAARELAKLKTEDMEAVLNLLKTLRPQKEGSG